MPWVKPYGVSADWVTPLLSLPTIHDDISDAIAYSTRRVLDNAFPKVTLTQDTSFEFKIDPDPALENEKEETPVNTMYNEKNCRVAGVTLEPYHSKEYAYALLLKDVETGAKVVVRNSDGSLVMGRLASVDKHPHEKVKNGCEVICVVDMTEYNQRQEQFAKVAGLRKKMDARVKALQDIALYEMLAKDDPELQTLLSEFKSLGA